MVSLRGLVYSLLLAAALAGGSAAGALAMLGFGLGTLPAMSALSYADGWLPRREGWWRGSSVGCWSHAALAARAAAKARAP
jgi:sulfite exporter TauE/SafE